MFLLLSPQKGKTNSKVIRQQLTLFDNIASENKMLVTGYDHKDSNLIIINEHYVQFAKWGLIPFWSKSEYAEKVIKKN